MLAKDRMETFSELLQTDLRDREEPSEVPSSTLSTPESFPQARTERELDRVA
jgi:hypothetical protein